MSEQLVTLGFRCSPSIKGYLKELAEEKNSTLSQYVNDFILASQSEIHELKNQVTVLNQDNQNLKVIIGKFETPSLKMLFQKYKGQSANVIDSNGEKQKLLVNSIYDLHNVIVSSFK